MDVRVAGPEDAQTVARLLGEFRSWYGKDQPDDESFERSVRRIMESGTGEYLLGGDPPQGVLQLRYRWSIWAEAEDAWLEDLWVREAARGGGLGRALVEAAFERARARGCRRIELDVDSDNAPARALYAATGFGDKGAQGTLFLQRRLN